MASTDRLLLSPSSFLTEREPTSYHPFQAENTETTNKEMPNGYWDRILHVDLGTGTTRVESFGEAYWRRHLGGRSLIAHYLLTEVPIGTDPLSPDNVLIFAAGVL